MKRWLTRCLALIAVGVCADGRADSQDFQLYKIGVPSDHNDDFRIFANQLGVAITSTDFSPPETLGHSGFNVAIGYAVAKIGDTREQVWPKAGGNPSDALLMPTVVVRKGLPFSFELGARFAYLTYSRMAAATLEVKWALNEGLLYLPDLGVRGHGTRLVGARDFGLTTAGVDVGLGKQFAIGGMVTLTPYAGWDLIFVSCTSNVIDFAPDRPLDKAQNTPAETTGAFAPVLMSQNHSSRFYAGLRFIASVLELGAEASVTQTYATKQILVLAAKVGLDF